MKITEGMSPMMRHYLEVKDQYPDCFLFYRLGDFYEMFFEDAVNGSKIMELTLTGRDCGLKERAPMCGVPYHSVDTYVQKLISRGYKVAICEQMEDPALAKGLVQRSVTRVITPGTVIEEKLLDAGKNNYLMSVYYSDNGIGYAYADVSTGEFLAGELEAGNGEESLLNELGRIAPSECIANGAFFEQDYLKKRFQNVCYLEKEPDSVFQFRRAEEVLKTHFGVSSLNGFGMEHCALAVSAAGALMQYLRDTQKNNLAHIRKLSKMNRSAYMQLDAAARRNLELTEPLRFGGSKKNTLLYLLDKTETAMGRRMLKTFVDCPLQSLDAIEYRQEAVEELYGNSVLRSKLRELLGGVYDIERLCSKVAYGTINPRDCISLLRSLRNIPSIQNVLEECESQGIQRILQGLDPMEETAALLEEAIDPDPAPNLKDGGVIRAGYSQEVDDLRDISHSAQKWLDDIITREREQTGIKNLRIGFNKVFGYYLEVSKSFTSQVPYYYERKQTLTNAERYITPELKEVENKVLTSHDALIRLESDLFDGIRGKLHEVVSVLEENGALISELDVYQSFAQVAVENHYVRPQMHTGTEIIIKGGRHPVVEQSLKEGFIPNDVVLDGEENRLLIITGPNMAGKSTYMRQVALITLMAHIGSFVPAEEAKIAIVDRIFTRIGASDDLSSGQSTFMVEMSEVANILNNATEKSLLILDEIGRGTSTYDGLSIAWAVLEHVAERDKCGAKALFATHYHELSELEGQLQGVKNYRISVKELGDSILFLRRIVRGSADKSFGVQVARLAGIPEDVICRAGEILTSLENADAARRGVQKQVQNSENLVDNAVDKSNDKVDNLQNAVDKSVLDDLKKLDMDLMSPIEALNKLYQYKAAFKQGDNR